MKNLNHDWRRLPRSGEQLEGFGRSAIYSLIKEGSVRAKVIRKPGSRKGLCFVDVISIRELIENAPDARTAFGSNVGAALS